MKGLPCLTEFYLYVQWHNLAFATISDLQVPSFTFNYEDYTDRFEAVTDELINFLEVKRVGEAPEFINNKKYGEYYTAQEKHAIATFIKEFATKATWQRVEHYLNDFLDEPKEGVESTVWETSRSVVAGVAKSDEESEKCGDGWPFESGGRLSPLSSTERPEFLP